MTPLDALSANILRASWQASLLAIAIILLQRLLLRRLSANTRYILWSFMLLRLALPFTISRPASLPTLHVPPPTITATHHPILFTTTPAHALPVPSAIPHTSWPHRLAIIWLIGCAISILAILLSTLRLWRHLRRQHPINDPRLQNLLTACAADLNIRRLPRLLTGPDSAGPALVGFLRPRLLLPQSILQFDDQSLRLILLHELTHLKRCDIPVNWLLAILQTLHWFNPVVHLCFARIRADRELACDERVLSMTHPADRPAYGQTIVRLIESLANPSCRLTAPPAIGILEGRRQLRRRITMIAEHRPTPRMWSLLAVVTITLIAIIACTDPARAGNGAPAAAPTSTPIQGKIVLSHDGKLPSIDGVATLTILGQNPDDPRLAQRLPALRFDSIPLSEALDFVRQQAKLNLFVDRQSLSAAGVAMDTSITIDALKDITVDQAFRLIGKAAASTDANIAAIADGDVIVFGVVNKSAAAPANDSATKVATPDISSHQDGLILQVYDTDKLTGNDPAKLQTLVDVVTASINTSNPSSVLLSVKPFNGKLIVNATDDVQDQVVNLLSMLTDRAPAKFPVKFPATKPADGQ